MLYAVAMAVDFTELLLNIHDALITGVKIANFSASQLFGRISAEFRPNYVSWIEFGRTALRVSAELFRPNYVRLPSLSADLHFGRHLSAELFGQVDFRPNKFRPT